MVWRRESRYFPPTAKLAVLGKRLEKFGLQLHPEKTRLVDFRPIREEADGAAGVLPRTFVFLGFLHLWGRSRYGKQVVRQFTAKERYARSLTAFAHQCRRMMHWPLPAQHERLCRMLRGHYGYFGISGNYRRLVRLHHRVQWLWRRWLSRRTARRPVSWERHRAAAPHALLFRLHASSIATPLLERSCMTTNRMR